MNAEGVIALVTMIICAMPLVGLGIAQLKSKVPVVFWAGSKPPPSDKVSNVKEYNKKHGLMWILYGVGLIAGFLPGILTDNGTIIVVFTIGECFGGLIIMGFYHNYLNKKYLLP